MACFEKTGSFSFPASCWQETLDQCNEASVHSSALHLQNARKLRQQNGIYNVTVVMCGSFIYYRRTRTLCLYFMYDESLTMFYHAYQVFFLT